MTLRIVILTMLIFFTFPCKMFAHHVLPTGFVSEEIATGLNPTCMAVAEDGRVFIGEKTGELRLVENDILLSEPLLKLDVNHQYDNGLLGITLDQDFGLNGYIYIYFTSPLRDLLLLHRYTINGDAVVPGSEVELFRIDEEGFGDFHSGGGLRFGLDGKLYLSTGDQAITEYSQSFSSLNGKVLRLNKDGSIPSDNPFYNQLDGDFRAIYALGFRNPFSLA